MRFLTLTSSDAAPDDIQRSWRALQMRMVRRGLLKGYIKVPETTADGRKHLHVLFRGSYIEQLLIRKWWSEIHNSSIVDIRILKIGRAPRRVASYMAKYMSKEMAGRYSWSWGWVWRGFCKDWALYKRWWWNTKYVEGVTTFHNMIAGWNLWLVGAVPLDRDAMAWDLNPTVPRELKTFFSPSSEASNQPESSPTFWAVAKPLQA